MAGNASRPTTVLVTGASGFIAKHVVLQLLQSGYHVRGSVRDLERGEEIRQAVRPHLDDAALADTGLEFVELDLERDSGWADALTGIDALLHTASPFPMVQPDNEEEVIRPAVEGTLRALKAASAAGVDRVVLTSSSVAILGGTPGNDRDRYNETDWTDPSAKSATPYARSKTLAERAAWNFIAGEAPQLKLTVINPGLVVGPPLDDRFGTSIGVVERILKAQDPALPDVGFSAVDVRDIAAMHVRALERPEAVGERIAGVAGFLRFVDMAKALKEAFPDRRIVTFVAPHFVIRMIGLFDKSVRTILPDLGKRKDVDNAKAKSLLGIQFRDPRESVVESARFLLENGRSS